MLSCENVEIHLNGKIWFENFNFLFSNKKSKYLFLGESGVGKSLLFSTISGLLLPDRGDVKLFGKSLFERNNNKLLEVKKNIGVIFQTPTLISNLTVDQNLKLVSGIKNIKLEKLREALRRFNLGPFIDKRTDILSFGLKHLLGIILNILHGPEFLLWDDLTFIDSCEMKNEIMDLYEENARDTSSLISFSKKVPDFCKGEWSIINIEELRAAEV